MIRLNTGPIFKILKIKEDILGNITSQKVHNFFNFFYSTYISVLISTTQPSVSLGIPGLSEQLSKKLANLFS